VNQLQSDYLLARITQSKTKFLNYTDAECPDRFERIKLLERIEKVILKVKNIHNSPLQLYNRELENQLSGISG